jgi:hypothetical protein
MFTYFKMPSPYKISKMITHAVIIGLLIVVVVMLSRQSKQSGYEPGPLVTTPTAKAANGPQSIFDLRPNLECTPGPSQNASYYTNGLTPGGLCGDGDFVKNQLREFNIENGIGGSLLEKD